MKAIEYLLTHVLCDDKSTLSGRRIRGGKLLEKKFSQISIAKACLHLGAKKDGPSTEGNR